MKNVDPTRLAIDGGTPVRTKPLPWELPGAHWMGKEELGLVSRVVKAKSPFRFYGPDLQHMVDTLEKEFARKLGRKYALAVSCATAGLHVALGAMGIGPGDEVLLPGFLWVSCISAVVRLGAIPRMVDIDETFCMDPQDLERKITPRSRAVLLVHMSGAPGAVDRIAEICRQRGLKLVEDCAQSAGAKFKGKYTGSFGDVGVFSFQLNKNMSSGEGGMIVTDDERLFKRCFALHDLGYARNEQGRLDFSDPNYQLWGVGARMGELAGAVALGQFRKLDRIVGSMRKSKWAIRRQLAKVPGLKFRNILDPKGDSSPFLIMLFDEPDLARRFTKAVQAEGIVGVPGSAVCLHTEQFGLHWYYNNVSLVNRASISRDGWPWTHPANAFALDYNYNRGALPKCDELSERGCLLSIASKLTAKDVADIVAAVKKVAAKLLPA
jgi:8-amino-3,8-dideoxy-alpha-D-manno-octulosonate transaminase